MPANLADLINVDRALIFRITHRDNVRHLLEHGIQCRNSPTPNAAFVEIGNPEIIDRRRTTAVQAPPFGYLADYVPFYFTPCTPMLYNIVTGHGGITQRRRSDIVILVSSLDKLEQQGLQYVVADRNAALAHARVGSGRALLGELPWDLWRTRNFRRNPDKPDIFERYQAEALIHEHVPVAALHSLITYDADCRDSVASVVSDIGGSTRVLAQPSWYP